ncbi:MAG: ABC transporter ATP-binding protein/permease [Oscillospiraceae bacterium]|nr:ABC transporter ATP-binding protein/permease [Oscillospiraceae bacterium]
MLQLKSVTKNYEVGATVIEALKGIDLKFRENEFVSVLGPSGCGKTTMLNLLGGLDRYTSGDLIINGKSTKDFTDGDWDAYRNRRIGFVFQNYNLIPHQSVLRNVELALTLSGVSKSERRRRAAEVLEKVGLSDQLHKRPNQLSGGQMQRVSIARALVNNPDILLADEPTGALDSGTSEQIMGLIKEIALDRLVIMVTHNGELASKYSTRIIKLFDGRLVDDSNPYDAGEEQTAAEKKTKGSRDKTSMSFFTALSLSANNLMTKKTRTFMTAFAGSIGIIGIALILALSSGLQAFISKVQEDTLSTYPISIESTVADMSAIISAMRGLEGVREHYEPDMIYSHNVMSGMFEAMLSGREDNDLKAFKRHLDDSKDELDPLVNAISYVYNINLNIYESGGDIRRVNPSDMMRGMAMGGGMGMMGQGMNIWTEMIDNYALLESQYDVLAGRWAREKNEVVLIVDEHNEIIDYALYALGLKDPDEVGEMMTAIREGGEFSAEVSEYTYDELVGLAYKMVLSPDLYQKTNNSWVDMSKDEDYMRDVLDGAMDITVVGIIRPSENSSMTAITGAIGYLSSLTEHIISQVNASELVKGQKADAETDIFTGKPFSDGDEESVDMDSLSDEVKAYLATLTPDEQQEVLANYSATSSATYEGNLALLGVVDTDTPDTINIYPKDFEAKEAIEAFISDYNQANEDGSIRYTDFVGLMMSSVKTIINMISNVLIAFVGISLVVSSIMIGIITYVSVLERTREIGILKSIGARKRDISRVFNAETMIVGFTAGMLGVLITVLLTIPANAIIKAVSGVSNIAVLPLAGAVVLVLLSMGLTLLAGLIPSRVAANKDPVVALRTE